MTKLLENVIKMMVVCLDVLALIEADLKKRERKRAKELQEWEEIEERVKTKKFREQVLGFLMKLAHMIFKKDVAVEISDEEFYFTSIAIGAERSYELGEIGEKGSMHAKLLCPDLSDVYDGFRINKKWQKLFAHIIDGSVTVKIS